MKNRANDVAALIQNIGNAVAMQEAAVNSAGSAARENERFVNSLQGRINALTAAWQEFANTVMNSSALKGLVSVATELLSVITKIIDTAGTIPTIIGLAAGALSFTQFKSFNPFQTIEDNTKKSGKRFQVSWAETFKSMKTPDVFDFSDSYKKSIDLDQKLIGAYHNALNSGDLVAQQTALNHILDKGSESAQKFAQGMNADTESKRDNQQVTADLAKHNQRLDVSQQAQNKSLSNVSKLVGEYNKQTQSAGKAATSFADDCAKGNQQLGKYLKNVGNGKATMGGYVASLIGAKAATIGLEVATMALNAVVMAGIGMLISFGISAIGKMITAASDLADKVDEVTSAYKGQHDELIKNKSSFDELAESYGKLSKGVDNKTGKNIGLTTSEFEEYQSVVNQIADMVPSLVAGYDEQGNAILNCGDNVKELTDAYKDLIIEENNALLNGNGEDYKGIADISDDLDNEYDKMSNSGIWGDKLTMLGAEQLEKILSSSTIDSSVVKEYAGNTLYQIGTSLKNAFKEKGIELEGVEMPSMFSSRETWNNFIAEACKQHPEVARAIIENMNAEMDASVQEMRTAMSAHMENAFLSDGHLVNIDEDMQKIAEDVVNGLDSSLIMRLNETGGEQAVLDYVDKILNAFNELSAENIGILKNGFDLSSKFESGDLSYGEYIDELERTMSLVQNMGLDEEIVSQIKLQLNVDEVNEQYNALKNRLTSDEFGIKMNAEEAEAFLDGLSSTEVAVAMDLIASGKVDLSNITANEFRDKIRELAEIAEAMNFTISIETETAGIEAFNTALAESRSATGLTEESMAALKDRYRDLEGYDAATLFQETAHGVSLNAEAVNDLESAYADAKLKETNDNIGTLKDRYDELGVEIRECGDATRKAELVSEREDIRNRIVELAELASAYEGLTSSYNEWQNAEAAGNNRDMYSNVHSAMEGVGKELELGWIDDGTEEYFQLIWGEDKWSSAGKSVSDYRKKWATLDDTISGTSYSLQDFFKTNEDGELTSQGIFNFFKAVDQVEDKIGRDVVKRDKDGNIVSFDFGVDGDKAIADALGISEELVQIFLRASQDAGFVVNFDGTYTQLADLQNEAMAAQNRFNEIFDKEYSFNFNTQSLSEAKADLKEAKKLLDNDDFWNHDVNGNRTTFNFEAEGATEAMQMVSTLQAMVDNLDNTYIGMTVDDEAFREPLEKAQDYELKIAELNQLELDPKANADEITALKDEIKDVIGYFAELDDDTKKKLGIPVELEGDALNKQIEKMLGDGSLKIPTVLDLQTNMNENIEELVKLSLYNSGMLTPDEKIELEQEFRLKYIKSDDSDDIDDVTEDIYSNNLITNTGMTVISDVDVEAGEVNTSKAEKSTEEILNGTNYLGDVEATTNVNLESGEVNSKKFVEDVHDKGVEAVENSGKGPIVVQQQIDFEFETPEEKLEEIKQFTNGLGEEKKKVVIDFISNNDEEFWALSKEERQIVVDLITDDSSLEALEGHQVEIEAFANIFGVEKVDDLKKKLDGLSDEQIQILAKVIGQIDVEKLKTTVSGLDDKTVQAIAKALGEGDVQGLKTTINGLDNKTVQAIAQAFGYSDVNELNNAIDNLDPKTVQAIAQALGITDVNSLRGAVNRLDNKTVQAVANVDGKDDVVGLKGAIDNLKGKTITVWATIKKKASDLWGKLTGGGGVDGTAHVGGTAFAEGTTSKAGNAFKQGNWGTKEDGTALVGELGPETLVRNGRYYVIGEDSAEFVNYKKGDIIFNAKQTEELFSKGKITHGSGRGKALAGGTAFANGSFPSSGLAFSKGDIPSEPTYPSSPSSSSKSGSSSSSDEFLETLDWIEVKIDRIEREISKLDLKAQSVYDKWGSRNTALVDQMGLVSDEIEIQLAGMKRYKQEADSVALSQSWKNKVINGEINIEDITDEDLKEKIDEFTEWHEKMRDCEEEAKKLQETLSDLQQQKFDNIVSEFEGMLGIIEHEKNMLEEFISQSEAKGWITSTKYYDALISNERESIAMLEDEKDALLKSLHEGVANGNIEKYSEAWYDQVAAIDEVTLAIEEGNTAILEYQNSIRDIEWEVFDILMEDISRITDETEFLIDLMSNKKLYVEEGKGAGQLTDEGMATMGLHGVNYNVNMNKADRYAAQAEIEKAKWDKDPNDMKAKERYYEMLELQKEHILLAEKEKDAIRDMVEEGIDLELDHMQELINAYEERLDAEKD